MTNKILPASGLLIANGALLLAFATRRYWSVLSALRRDKFPINTRDTLIAVFMTATNTMASLVIVWRAEQESRTEKRTVMEPDA